MKWIKLFEEFASSSTSGIPGPGGVTGPAGITGTIGSRRSSGQTGELSKVNIIFLKFLIEKYLEKHERKDRTDKIQIVKKSRIRFNKKVLASIDFEVDSSGKKTYQEFDFNVVDFMQYLKDSLDENYDKAIIPKYEMTIKYSSRTNPSAPSMSKTIGIPFVQHLLMNQLVEKFLKEWKMQILKDRPNIYRTTWAENL